MDLNSETVKSEQLGSLGLVASVIRELGIIEKIDKRLELSESKGGIGICPRIFFKTSLCLSC